MQRVGSSFSTGQREPTENRVASRCPSVALAERSQVATLPVRLLKDDLAAAQGNGCEEPSFQMKVDAQGFAPEDLVVRIDGQNLTVTGQRQQESNDPSRGRYRMEQSVHRQMQLPPTLDTAAMTCSLTPSGHLWLRGQNKCLPPAETQTGPQTGQALSLRRGGPRRPNLP
ncbi:heat shock protein beta-9 isoform X1 [Grammomys surdaster]|uniref:heat shock protein beta-9 isoform X1 n=1 Tax=Grammomys surdaster TaxID=491861 RepID=UPI00109F955D|nr:heat shock protein beta-9 isoform X1 [Grammomys surdaster]